MHAGCVGVVNADLVFHGRTAHSARPWEGDSAVLRAVPFLERAAQVAQRPVEVEGLTFHDTLCITQIHGGVARNVVPDRVEIALNVRFAPGREAAAARAEVEELVAGEGELTWLDESPAAPPRLSEPVLAQFLAETGVQRAPEAGLDGRRLAAGARDPGRQLRAGRGAPGAPAGRVGRRRGDRARRVDARPLPATPLIVTVGAMRVAKWQALGNHFLVVEEPPWPITPARARLLCDVALGLGADGVLELSLDGDEVAVVVHNRDGSIAEISGNGTRIAVAYAAERLGRERAARAHGRGHRGRRRCSPTGASRCGSGRPRSRGRRRISARRIPASTTASSRSAIPTAC